MDRRAVTVDPNVEESLRGDPSWWKQIGPTQKPSPYATATWVYRHYSDYEMQTVPSHLIPEVFDNYSDFAVNVYPTKLDGGLFSAPTPPSLIYDEGGYDGLGPVDFIKHYFSSIKVYDFLASHPGKYEEIDLSPVDRLVPTVYDNSNDIQTPIPDPNSIYNSETFAQWGRGIKLNEWVYDVRNSTQHRVNPTVVVLPDGTTQAIGELDAVTAIRTAEDEDWMNPGELLGQLEYEILGSTLTITNWSHYNWHDATPVRKAFKSLINSLPVCIDSVLVEDEPRSFWTELGFVSPAKGSEILVYNEKIKKPVAY